MNLENSYITEEDLYFKDCFTETEDGINMECNNININCLTSQDNKFSLDNDGNLYGDSIEIDSEASIITLSNNHKALKLDADSMKQ